MNIDGIDISTTLPVARFGGSGLDKPGFDALLAKARSGEDLEHGRDPARKVAEDLVATTFLAPLLSMLREDPFKSDLFHGGQGEELFGARLDEVIGDRITRAANFPIVEAVYRQLTQPGMPANAVDTHG